MLYENKSIIVRSGIFEENENIFQKLKKECEIELKADSKAVDVDFLDIKTIVILFDSFADGRGFSIARQLRQFGYIGIIRAKGHLLADQYPLAIRCGFDEVEISSEHAKRQPQHQWSDSFTRVKNNYQDRLMLA